MRREITGYSIRGRGESGTGLMFVVILLLPFAVVLLISGPTSVLQFFGPALDTVLQRVGASSSVTTTRADTPVPPAAPIRLPSANWDVRDGHFFTETNGQMPLVSPTGFLVSNAGDIPFWNQLRRLGGEVHLGYPISQRFTWRGATVQVFQRGVMQSTGGGSFSMVNVMDELTLAGKDDFLTAQWFIPPSLPANFGIPGDPFGARMELFALNPAFQTRFDLTPEALTVFGLATSQPTSMNDYVTTLRTQRTALHLWKKDGPWGKVNDVTVANSGEIALSVGLFSNPAITPEAPPPS